MFEIFPFAVEIYQELEREATKQSMETSEE